MTLRCGESSDMLSFEDEFVNSIPGTDGTVMFDDSGDEFSLNSVVSNQFDSAGTFCHHLM